MIHDKRFTLLVALVILTHGLLWSQDPPVLPELNNPSTADVMTGGSSLLDKVESICYILGAMCAIIGGFLAYTEVIDGEENVFVAVRNWFGCCIAFVVFPFIIRSIAGV